MYNFQESCSRNNTAAVLSEVSSFRQGHKQLDQNIIFFLFGRFNKCCIFGGKFSENDNQLLSYASRWVKKLLRIIHKMLTENSNFILLSTNQIANQNTSLQPHEPMSGKNSKETTDWFVRNLLTLKPLGVTRIYFLLTMPPLNHTLMSWE